MKNVNLFLDYTVHNMLEELKGKVVFFLGDSSPDRHSREWLSFGVTFICPKTFTFNYMPLGIHQALGRLTSKAYTEHVEEIFNAWGIVKEKDVSLTPDFVGWKNYPKTLVVGGGSDCGAGLFQVFKLFFGKAESGQKQNVFNGPCMVHGVFNILSDVLALEEVSLERGPKHYVEEIEDLLGLLRNRLHLEMVQQHVKLSFPSTHKRKRWTSLKDGLTFLFENWGKLKALEGTVYDVFTVSETGERDRWNWNSTFEMIRIFYAILSPLFEVIEKLQCLGPLDGICAIFDVIQVLHKYSTLSFQVYKWDDDNKVMLVEKLNLNSLTTDETDVFKGMTSSIEYIKKNLCRRFFTYSIGDVEDHTAVSGIKWDYLQNTTVLALFALSPLSDFLRFIASPEQIQSLVSKSRDAVSFLFNKINGEENRLPPKPTVTNIPSSLLQSYISTIGISENKDNDVQQNLWRHITSVVKDETFLKAFCTYWDTEEQKAQAKTVANVKAIFKKRNLVGERLGLFSSWRDCINRHTAASTSSEELVTDTLIRILCIAGSQVFSNAVTERNFSSVTRFLSPQRSRTGSTLLSAQVLACRAKKWAQFKCVKKKESCQKGGLITDHFKTGKAAFMKLGSPETIQDGTDEENEEEHEVIIEEKEELAEPELDTMAESSGDDSSNNVIHTAQRTTRRSTRTNRGTTMQAIIATLYKAPMSKEMDKEKHMYETREDQSDSESEYEE
jgi:hypothetical protein